MEIAREADLGVNDERYTASTHLGRILKTGDTVLGYHLSSQANLNAEELGLKGDLPDVILVRKVYEKRGKRKWTLKNLEKEECEENVTGGGRGRNAQHQFMDDGDREFFFQQLEVCSPTRRLWLWRFEYIAAAASVKCAYHSRTL